jgi:hypothetical protein
MMTISGNNVSRDHGSPSIYDIAVHLMRLCRYGGGTRVFWPVGMHTMVVADLLPDELEVYGLLHDGDESVGADIPRPFKTNDYRSVMKRVRRRMFNFLGVPPMTPEMELLVKAADNRSANAEMHLVGPRGIDVFVDVLEPRDLDAEKVMQKYLTGFNPVDCITLDGYWVNRFESRLRRAIYRSQSGKYLI